MHNISNLFCRINLYRYVWENPLREFTKRVILPVKHIQSASFISIPPPASSTIKPPQYCYPPPAPLIGSPFPPSLLITIVNRLIDFKYLAIPYISFNLCFFASLHSSLLYPSQSNGEYGTPDGLLTGVVDGISTPCVGLFLFSLTPDRFDRHRLLTVVLYPTRSSSSIH